MAHKETVSMNEISLNLIANEYGRFPSMCPAKSSPPTILENIEQITESFGIGLLPFETARSRKSHHGVGPTSCP